MEDEQKNCCNALEKSQLKSGKCPNERVHRVKKGVVVVTECCFLLLLCTKC